MLQNYLGVNEVSEMKDSGFQWIGMIPANWKCERGKYILEYIQKPIKENDGVITCFRDGEVTLRSKRREDGFTMADKEIGYQGIDVGDLVVHGMDGFAGAIGISDSRGKASPVLNVLDTKQNKKYIMYFLRSMAYNNVFLALATGIRVRSCDLRWNKLAELYYPVPSLDEQNRIVEFLDAKCTETDILTKNIQAEIYTLEEYRMSIINEVMMYGINGKGKHKEVRFKYIATVKSNLVPPTFYLEYPQVSPENIAKNTGKLLSYSTVEDSGIISGNHLFYKGQIIYSKIRPNLNKAIIASFDGLCSADMYPIEAKINSKYLLYAMLSKHFVEQVTLIMQDRVKMPKINQDELGNIRVYVAPAMEQKEIVLYLDKKCAEIDSIIETKKQQLTVLDEYKKTIIYEYVTGKKEVV